MTEVFGGNVVRAPSVMHGKTSAITHDGQGVFQGLPNPIRATRYHSLIAERASVENVPSVSDKLEITATTSDGLIMGLRHRYHKVEGVQFHPESVLTSKFSDASSESSKSSSISLSEIGLIGKQMIRNFLELL